MNPNDLPLYVSTVIVLTAVVMAALVLVGVRRLARLPGVLSAGPGDTVGAAQIAALDRWMVVIVAVWAAAALLVTYALGGRATLFGLAYVAGMSAIGYGLVVLTDPGQRLLAAVPQTWLIGAQTFRVVGGVFLIVASYGALPAYFAIPAGWGDFITGLAAPLVAGWWAAGAPFARRAAWVWNTFGLLDLVVAVGIGISLFAQPAAAIFGGSPAWLARAALGFQPLGAAIFPVQTPLTLVPTFLVPFAILFHLLSLRKLAMTEGMSLRSGGDSPLRRRGARGGAAALRG